MIFHPHSLSKWVSRLCNSNINTFPSQKIVYFPCLWTCPLPLSFDSFIQPTLKFSVSLAMLLVHVNMLECEYLTERLFKWVIAWVSDFCLILCYESECANKLAVTALETLLWVLNLFDNSSRNYWSAWMLKIPVRNWWVTRRAHQRMRRAEILPGMYCVFI